MEINERIKARRQELGLSVDDIAEKLNINRATYYRYESEEIKKFPLDIVVPLANILQISPQALMGWDKEDNPKRDEQQSAPAVIYVDDLTEKEIEEMQRYKKFLISCWDLKEKG